MEYRSEKQENRSPYIPLDSVQSGADEQQHTRRRRHFFYFLALTVLLVHWQITGWTSWRERPANSAVEKATVSTSAFDWDAVRVYLSKSVNLHH